MAGDLSPTFLGLDRVSVRCASEGCDCRKRAHSGDVLRFVLQSSCYPTTTSAAIGCLYTRGFGQERTINECQPKPSGMVQDDSELTVSDDGKVGYRISTGILCDGARPALEPDAHFGFRWKQRLPERVVRYKLSETELNKFKAILEREDVVRLHSFLSAAPASAEYRFTIWHSDRPTDIEVVGFDSYPGLPPQVSGQDVSGLTAIVCVARALAHNASKTVEVPRWCKGNEPFDSKYSATP